MVIFPVILKNRLIVIQINVTNVILTILRRSINKGGQN